VIVKGGERIKYNKLLIATGTTPRRPPVPGVNLKNVFTIRNYHDAENIRDASRKAKNIVIVGASFIGMEAAACIKKQLKD
jgi:NADPH-dependent 2,4-dienoyl-CoA reductase/sulfur reductase-like enzyme